MYPASFEYAAPQGLDEALALLQRFADASPKVLAGGQSLIPLMKLRLATPSHLVDLRRLAGLSYVREEGDWLRIGAMTTESEIERSPLLQQKYPILVDTSSVIADPLVRNLATIGGNLAHGDPANDHPAVMVSLGAKMAVLGSGGERVVEAERFFRDIFVTDIAEDEILTGIQIPMTSAGAGGAYLKFERQVGDYAIAGVAVSLRLAGGRITESRIAFTNLGSVAARAAEAERLCVGEPPDDSLFREASRVASHGLNPWADLRGDGAYKQRVATVLTHRALTLAAKRTAGAS
ncbi:MAG TPA: xanthine dehydrogenase family protein subunit M [Actinomycetota bacterium]|nr:xanthine dehydrogenase family protein subunit M [Actinomycetota bacterium]